MLAVGWRRGHDTCNVTCDTMSVNGTGVNRRYWGRAMIEADDVAGDHEAPPAEACRIEITGPGLSVTRSLPMQRLPALLDYLLRQEQEPSSAPPTPGPAAEDTPAADSWRQGLRAYYDDKRPATNPERIAVLGRFVEVAEGRTSFSKEELRHRFLSAEVPLPRNFSRDFATAVRRGYLVALSDGYSYLVGSGVRRLIDRDGPALLPRS